MMPEPTIDLVSAARFTLEALTRAYNNTRVDYLIPMSMNAARLAAYLRWYDVDLDHSWVALEGSQVLGLAMLGVRPGRTWVTRLGVLPAQRRRGTGQALVEKLLASTRELGRPLAILEVIQGNTAAHQLFRKEGFRETRDLLILRRAPGSPAELTSGTATWLEEEDALDLLCSYPERLPWTNEMETYINAGGARALRVELPGGQGGWLVFRQARQLSHFVLHTSAGDPAAVAGVLLGHLYQRFPTADSYIENVTTMDPHLPALLQAGFREAFRRVEMHWRAE